MRNKTECVINNSDIKNVVNLSRDLSLAVVNRKFPYDVPLEFVEKLFKDNLPGFKERIPAIVEGPFYKRFRLRIKQRCG